ncbi:MAG TPA: protein kinase, partial [Polyangiaceae bacterium]|nr:protein kinase [Polyangiaceae bacterium]
MIGPKPEDRADPTSELEREVLKSTLRERLLGDTTLVMLGRFELLRTIGRGGMGVVFEAIDTRSQQHVALKVLRLHGHEAASSIKREFRAVASAYHRNLVALYELFADEQRVFFTMELVHGSSIREYVTRDGKPDRERLWRVMCQLVDALSVLHDHGLLHRDLKSSNVLVQSDGRLVLLDFGLVRELNDPDNGGWSGTRAYIAPERLAGSAATDASDWYSIGVMLLEALTEKSANDPRFRDAPDWGAHPHDPMVALCQRLLSHRPSERPTARALRELFELPVSSESSSPVRPSDLDGVFVGRRSERGLLHAAFERAEQQRCAVVYVHGEPGIGKTALVKELLAELQAQHAVYVFAGRCYERERVSYNAVDGVIDALAQQLRSMPESDRVGLVPEGSAELAHVFPILAQAITAGHAGDVASMDPHRDRERALAALRVLLTNLAARQPVVLHVDDLQWGDADSAHVLSELVRDPPLRRLLLIVSYRTADARGNPGVTSLRALRPVDERDTWELCLTPMPRAELHELARDISRSALAAEELEELVEESNGSPLFLRTLLQYRTVAMRATAGQSRQRPTTLNEVLRGTMKQSPAPMCHLLELLAIAGRPLERDLLLSSADPEQIAGRGHEWLIALQRSGLVREVADALDTYHDRVRETIAESIEPELKQRHHARLAASEGLSPSPDVEFLAYHHEQAGQLEPAAHHAEAAGDRARDKLAADRAAELYAIALRCLPEPAPLRLLEKLADATAFAGRLADAAPIYVRAAACAESSGTDALRLRLRATEMMLRRGKVKESVELAQPVLHAVGLRYPSSAAEAALSILVNLAQLKLRTYRFHVKHRSDEHERLHRELCFVLGYRLV